MRCAAITRPRFPVTLTRASDGEVPASATAYLAFISAPEARTKRRPGPANHERANTHRGCRVMLGPRQHRSKLESLHDEIILHSVLHLFVLFFTRMSGRTRPKERRLPLSRHTRPPASAAASQCCVNREKRMQISPQPRGRRETKETQHRQSIRQS